MVRYYCCNSASGQKPRSWAKLKPLLPRGHAPRANALSLTSTSEESPGHDRAKTEKKKKRKKKQTPLTQLRLGKAHTRTDVDDARRLFICFFPGRTTTSRCHAEREARRRGPGPLHAPPHPAPDLKAPQVLPTDDVITSIRILPAASSIARNQPWHAA